MKSNPKVNAYTHLINISLQTYENKSLNLAMSNFEQVDEHVPLLKQSDLSF
jgi:hypothetical protein